MANLRFFELNLPDIYRHRIEQEREDAADMIIKGFQSASASSNEGELINLWIPATHRFMDIHKFSSEEQIGIIQTTFGIISSMSLSIDGLNSMISIFNRLLKIRNHVETEIEWKVMYHLYEWLVSSKESKQMFYGLTQISNLLSELARAMKTARKYYSKNSTTEIIDTFRKKICPGGDINEAITYITTLIPNKGEVDSWCIDILLEALDYDHRNISILMKVIKFLSASARANPNLNWDLYLPKILDYAITAMPLLPNPAPKPKVHMSENKKLLAFQSNHMKNTSGIVKLIVFTLKEQGNSLKYFQQFVQNIRSHLKEDKMATHMFIQYINQFGNQMAKRIKHSQKSASSVVSPYLSLQFLNILLPCVEVIFNTRHLGHLEKLFNCFSFISPEKFINFCSEYCTIVFQDYNISHTNAIDVLRLTLRATLDSKLYPHSIAELPLLIENGLSELTSSDIEKSCKLLDYYAVLASVIALDDSAGDMIREWGQGFMEKLLETISKLEEKSEEDAKKGESGPMWNRKTFTIEESLKNGMRALVSSVGIDIYYFWVNDFVDFVKTNTCDNAQNEFGIIVSELARRTPQRVINALLDLTKIRTLKNGEVSSRSPKEIS